MSQFFSSNGISSSRANHIANVAKEVAEFADKALGRFSVINAVYIKDGVASPVKEPTFDKTKAVELMTKKPRLFQLSAWLRQAIRERESLLKNNQESQPSDLENDVERPKLQPQVDETWGRAQLTIKEMAEYLGVEAEAAAIGKFIHNNGFLPNLLSEYDQPRIQWRGDDYIKLDMPVPIEEVQELFLEQQKLHRQAESRVNYYKAKVQNLVNEENMRRTAENNRLQEKYMNEMKQLMSRNEAKRLAFNENRIRRSKEISDMKIVIPYELQTIFDEVVSLAEAQKS